MGLWTREGGHYFPSLVVSLRGVHSPAGFTPSARHLHAGPAASGHGADDNLPCPTTPCPCLPSPWHHSDPVTSRRVLPHHFGHPPHGCRAVGGTKAWEKQGEKWSKMVRNDPKYRRNIVEVVAAHAVLVVGRHGLCEERDDGNLPHLRQVCQRVEEDAGDTDLDIVRSESGGAGPASYSDAPRFPGPDTPPTVNRFSPLSTSGSLRRAISPTPRARQTG